MHIHPHTHTQTHTHTNACCTSRHPKPRKLACAPLATHTHSLSKLIPLSISPYLVYPRALAAALSYYTSSPLPPIFCPHLWLSRPLSLGSCLEAPGTRAVGRQEEEEQQQVSPVITRLLAAFRPTASGASDVLLNLDSSPDKSMRLQSTADRGRHSQ
jgi:hypothetical protein